MANAVVLDGVAGIRLLFLLFRIPMNPPDDLSMTFSDGFTRGPAGVVPADPPTTLHLRNTPNDEGSFHEHGR